MKTLRSLVTVLALAAAGVLIQQSLATAQDPRPVTPTPTPAPTSPNPTPVPMVPRPDPDAVNLAAASRSAGEALSTFRQLITGENFKTMGFQALAEAEQAVLGEALPMYTLSLGDL